MTVAHILPLLVKGMVHMFQATAICRLSMEAVKAFMNGYASLHKGAMSRLSMKVRTAWTKSYGSS